MNTNTVHPRTSVYNSLEHSTRTITESLIDSERLKWKSYLNDSKSHSDLIRLSLTEYIHNLVLDQNRSIFHLTTTYKPYQDRIYSKSDVDRFFTCFYTKYLLPRVLSTRNIHRPSKRMIQPITFTFTEEHLQSFDSDRLHHHSILCVHPSTLEFFRSLPQENPIDTDTPYTHKICTSHIRECEPMTLLYSSHMLKKYPDFLSFP
jgi:hypothetical protein